MTATKKKGKDGVKTLEDRIHAALGEATSDPKKNIDLYGEYIRESNQNAMLAEVIHPAVDEGYARASAKIDELYKDGKVTADEGNFHQILIEYMRGILEKTHPSVLKTIDEIKDTKKRYEVLAGYFDQLVGAGQIEGVQRISGLAEILKKAAEDDDKFDANKLKVQFYNYKEGHAKGAHTVQNSKVSGLLIESLPPGTYQTHLLGLAEEEGYAPKNDTDRAKFLQARTGELAGAIHGPIINDQTPLYKDLGLKKMDAKGGKHH
ncbi:MAG: hypothetical protein EPN86_02595 [Nanoarchaeota archaeon]|nr:MAG: hypothetical protein EPN86_02595 [Nanoarchaeota archaeon]